MYAILINSSEKVTLSPLCTRNDILSLPIMGRTVEQRIKEYLERYKVTAVKYCGNGETLKLDDTEVSVVTEKNLITNTDINEMINIHRASGADMTAALRQCDDESGIRVRINSDSVITAVYESGKSAMGGFEAEGIFIVNGEIINSAAEDGEISGASLIKTALKLKKRVCGYISSAAAVKINSVNSYKKCHSDIMSGKLSVSLGGHMIKEGLWIEENVTLESGVKIETPAYISGGCRIERGAKIGGETFLSQNCTVKANAEVSHSVVGKNCTLSENVSVSGAVMADNVNIGMNSVLNENAVIGADCRIEEDCVLKSGVRIWRNKRIKKGTRVNDNLVWGSVGTERLFRDGKLYGEVNIDITPEFMAKLGAALGTMYNGERIGLGYDSAPVCTMLARAASSGIISSGARLFTFGDASLPVMRDGTRYYGLKVSLYINQSDSDGIYYPEIEFVEADGSNLKDENISLLEGIFFNNVFYRADVLNICEATSVKEFRMSYIQDILNKIESKRFAINMELQTKSETVSEILEVLLSEIERHTEKDIEKQFIAELDRNGRLASLSDTGLNKLDKNQVLSIAAILLTEHFGEREIALPVSAPGMLEKNLKDNKINILKCGTSDEEFLRFLTDNNLYEEFRLCFDGIYFSVALLDYLNCRNISFSDLYKRLPVFIHREVEIECPDSKKTEIIRKLYAKYSDLETDTTEGIKIFKNNGWVLVLPESYRHCIKIITEGYDTETADELSTIFTNQIKRLAKLN